MASPDRSALGPSARHIAREYARARERGITQREFVNATGLSSTRYLRKIISGERSGKILEERAKAGGAFSIPVEYKHGKQTTQATVQVRLPYGTSRFDIYRPSVQKRIRKEVARERKAELSRSAAKINETNEARLRGQLKLSKIRVAKNVGAHIIPVLRRV